MILRSLLREFYWIERILHYISVFLDFTFVLLEIHMTKIIALSVMAFCCYNANPLHMLIVIVLVFSLPVSEALLSYVFRIIGLYLSVLLITKMIYQTKFIPKGLDLTFEDQLKRLLLDLKWMGYQMLEHKESILHLCGSYLLVLLVMTLHAVVSIRQRIKRIDEGKAVAAPDVMYPSIKRENADDDVRSCLKYFVNYAFYKFGVELTLTTAALVIAYRMDVMSSFYSCWLIVMFSLRRSVLSRMWPFFFATIILGILWQYAMVVGVPPRACIDYPWHISKALNRWLYLASYEDPPDGRKILADSVLMLFIWRQKMVFDIERTGHYYPGGSNKEVFMDYYKPNFVNPVPDQTAFNRSGIDMVKHFVITSMLWVTLAFVYWTGMHNVNVLSLGYLVGSFVFLWIGYDLCLWHMKKILMWWNALLAYTTLAIFLKSVYEVAGCVYIGYLNENVCWLVQLLNLGCTRKQAEESSDCPVSRSTGMYWDAICFGLMLIQRRIFLSYYFIHQAEDVKTLIKLQSRGARLIEQLMQEQMRDCENRKMKTLEKIKKNMNRIKEWKRKIHGLNYAGPTDHATAVHMGDYYMFEEALELEAVVEPSSSSEEEDSEEPNRDKKDKTKEGRTKDKEKELTMTQFIGTVYRKTAEDSKDKKRKTNGTSDEVDKAPKEEKGNTSTQTPDDRKHDESNKYGDLGEETPKLKSALRFLMDFLESVCVSMMRFFDKRSKDYRYIKAAMIEERKAMKMRNQQSSTAQLPKLSKEPEERNEKNEQIKDAHGSGSQPFTSDKSHEKRKRMSSNSMREQSVYSQLIVSFSFFVMSHTEFFCYVMIFLHQALSPTILSLPLPLCALLWGSLTTIGPTTTFWIVLIAYAEVTVVIKATFQNWIFPWNSSSGDRHHPYHPPLLLGIHRSNTYATADLFLLFMLFLHRYKLKSLGMWKRTNEEETMVPRDMGIYKELLPSKDKDDGGMPVLKKELESNARLKGTNQDGIPRLAKWKCTSKAMAKFIYRNNGKVKVKLNVREIEGQILVTRAGRRLKPTSRVVGQLPEGNDDGDVVLRVYPPQRFQSQKNMQCKLSCLQHCTPIRKFFIQIMDQKGSLSADFYTLIFFFDFLTFLIVFFGFSHFTEMQLHSTEEHFYLTENQVPLTYLFAVLIHFMIIVIDRVLYLRRNVFGKLILQISLVIVTHLWMFLVLPRVTDESFTEMVVPQIYYLIKCLYFLMSAYQMRVGYPLRIQSHFLCKRFGYVNYLSFKGLQFIPFFNELRVLLDYVCIQSSLSIMEWIKMESIYYLIFEKKCLRKADEDYPSKRGIMYPKCKKYVLGLSAFTFCVFVVWLPFILFAIFETVSVPNVPTSGHLEVSIGPYNRIYSCLARHEGIKQFTYGDFNTLRDLYRDNKKVWSFLSNYKFEDVAALKFRTEPSEEWKIMTSDFTKLNESIQKKEVAYHIYVTWNIFRTERAQIVASSTGTREFILPESGFIRDEFIRAFNKEENKIFLAHMLPKFLHVTNEGDALPVSGFFSLRNRTNAFRNTTLRLIFTNDTEELKYWELKELADDEFESTKLRKIPYQDENYITIYTFNEKNIPKPLLNISRRGILGLYLSTVLVSWTFIRRFMSKYHVIIYEDMPNVDRILQLCHDIYLARESHEFALEEDLYAKLIFLFRSPETLIKWTRRPVEEAPSLPN